MVKIMMNQSTKGYPPSTSKQTTTKGNVLSGTARAVMKDMEQSLAEGRLVDYWKKDDYFECIQVNHIRDISDEVSQFGRMCVVCDKRACND